MSSWSHDKKPAEASNDAAGGAFETSKMADALPEAATEATGDEKDMTVTGWVARQAYDYATYDADAENRQNWDGSAPIYIWDGEVGDIGPEVPELELELFGDKDKRELLTGIDFSKIADIELIQEGPVRVEPALTFSDAGLHPAMLKNIELCGYKIPTPIQAFCLPAIHKGYDVIGIAQTGSGKTAAYLIPVINKLMGKAKKLAAPRPNPLAVQAGIAAPIAAEPLVVIVAPTRELAVQIFNEARKLCYRSMLRPGVVYGGGPFGEQVKQVNMGCDILVATPGRLIHFMQRPEILTLRRVKYMIIDEADEMLADDWQTELEQVLSGGDQEEGNLTYLLFSATFPKKIRDLAKTHLAEDHVRFRVGRAGSTHSNIVQQILDVAPANKRKALVELIQSLPPQRTLIFVNSKPAADELDDVLYNTCKLPCTSMHSDRTQREREDALRSFRAGRTPILIATGVTARGIDVRNVAHVINYDLPSMDHGGIEEYTHRIGRTGRIGHKGLATSFFTERDEPIASVLTRTLLETNQDIPEFLTHHVPEDKENLKFEADSDWEGETVGDDGGNGGGWGVGSDNGGDAWGATEDDNKGGAWGAPAEDNKGGAWGITGDDNKGGAWGATGNSAGNGGTTGWESSDGNAAAKATAGAAGNWKGGADTNGGW